MRKIICLNFNFLIQTVSVLVFPPNSKENEMEKTFSQSGSLCASIKCRIWNNPHTFTLSKKKRH